MSTTPIGQAPATGGRAKQYSDDVERSRAWRARQKERQAPGRSVPASPQLAPASLSVSLERLGELVRSHQEAIRAEVTRVEEAIGVLSDPAAVAEATPSRAPPPGGAFVIPLSSVPGGIAAQFLRASAPKDDTEIRRFLPSPLHRSSCGLAPAPPQDVRPGRAAMP